MFVKFFAKHRQKLTVILAIVLVVWLLTTLDKSSTYSIKEREYASFGPSAIGPSAAPVNGGMQKDRKSVV